jgi:hypothetical protein
MDNGRDLMVYILYDVFYYYVNYYYYYGDYYYYFIKFGYFYIKYYLVIYFNDYDVNYIIFAIYLHIRLIIFISILKFIAHN